MKSLVYCVEALSKFVITNTHIYINEKNYCPITKIFATEGPTKSVFFKNVMDIMSANSVNLRPV